MPKKFYTIPIINLVTSQSPNGNDSVSLISYSEDDHQINRQIFKVPDNCGESWRIASSPKNETRFATSSSIVTECEKGYKQSWRCNIYQFDNEKITNDNNTATLGLDKLRITVWCVVPMVIWSKLRMMQYRNGHWEDAPYLTFSKKF